MLSSCDPQSCEDVDCGPYKDCVGGDCVCPQGLEGDACEIYSYEKFIGNYQVSENCTTSTVQNPIYTLYITPGNQIDRIVFNNFNNSGLSVEGVINGVYLQIPEQTTGSFTIEGSGDYNTATNRITINYNLIQSTNSSACTAICTKQ
jgi:hypothetical protein